MRQGAISVLSCVEITYTGGMSDDEYLPPTYLARYYTISARSLERWAREGRIRTRPSPLKSRAKLYNRADVERLAAAAQMARTTEQLEPAPSSTAPSTELVPQSDLLTALVDTQHRLERAMLEVGRLQGQIESQQKLLETADIDRQRRVEAESELERVRRDLSRLPWWVRILFLRGK
jgi:hypothetical protein